MKIFLYTPIFENSTFIPELFYEILPCEIDEQNFFYASKWINKSFSIWNWFITYNNIKSRNINFFLKNLEFAPSKSKIIDWIDFLKQEKSTIWETERIIERLGKKIFSRNFRINSAGRKSFEKVYNYHKLFFQNPSYILTDESNNIKYIHNISYSDYNWNSKVNPQKLYVTYKGHKNKIIYTRTQTPFDVCFILFLDKLMRNFSIYKNRFKEWYYYFEDDDIFFADYPNHIATWIYHNQNLNITKNFFENFKMYFLNYLTDFWSYIKIISILKTSFYPSDIAMKKFINNIDYDYIKNIIQK